MKKNLKNAEIVYIVKKIHESSSADEKNPQRAARLPFSVQWKKRLNLSELSKIREAIAEEEMRIDAKYADEEHSYIAKDATGKEMRRVKNAYITEFSQKKAELYNAETDVEIRTVSPEELDGANLTDLQMDSLMFMIEEEKTHG